MVAFVAFQAYLPSATINVSVDLERELNGLAVLTLSKYCLIYFFIFEKRSNFTLGRKSPVIMAKIALFITGLHIGFCLIPIEPLAELLPGITNRPLQVIISIRDRAIAIIFICTLR